MAVLAFDTSGGRCGVCVLASRTVVRVEAMQRGHADRLFALIEAAMGEVGVGYGDLTRIVVCTGPGVFTGLRIGVAAARGLALGCGVPAVGVTRFAALAAAVPGRIAVCLAERGGGMVWQPFADGAPMAAPARAGAEWVPPPGVGVMVGDWGAPPDAPLGVSPPGDDGGRGGGGLVDPVVLARLGAAAVPGARPAPLYLRGADADLPRDPGPVLLGP